MHIMLLFNDLNKLKVYKKNDVCIQNSLPQRISLLQNCQIP